MGEKMVCRRSELYEQRFVIFKKIKTNKNYSKTIQKVWVSYSPIHTCLRTRQITKVSSIITAVWSINTENSLPEKYDFAYLPWTPNTLNQWISKVNCTLNQQNTFKTTVIWVSPSESFNVLSWFWCYTH